MMNKTNLSNSNKSTKDILVDMVLEKGDPPLSSSTECKITNCRNELFLHGYCKGHYERTIPDTTTQGDDRPVGCKFNPCECSYGGPWCYVHNRHKEDCDELSGNPGKLKDINVPKSGDDKITDPKKTYPTGNKQNNNDNQNGNRQGDSGSIEGRLDDSVKEQIEEILWKECYQPNPEDVARISSKVSALFKSQESKTLERVREKVIQKDEIREARSVDNYARGYDDGHDAKEKIVLAILEAEQKGQE